MIRSPQIFGKTWFNTDHPITPEELFGRVVLVDFFNYSCVKCIDKLPFLKRIWDQYKHLNFLLIGIHTPKFDFEKNGENVSTALVDFEINWPVVLDNDCVNWRNFSVQNCPAIYLLDQNGFVIYQYSNEDGFDYLERKIQQLLEQDIGDKSLPSIFKAKQMKPCAKFTSLLYCGYEQGKIVNEGGYHYDHIANYIRPAVMPLNSIALAGQFESAPEYVESLISESTLFINFTGKEVNLVLAPNDDLAIVELKMNDLDLSKEVMGQDVDQGDVIITRPRLYNLIRSDSVVSGILSIKSKESNFRAYVFSFSDCST